MDLTTLVDILEPHIIRMLQSNKITFSNGGGTGGMEQHALYGPYHTGQLDESQALWVDSKITNKIADHTAQVDAHHAKVHSILDATNHVISGGAALDLIGQSAVNTLARITPSSAPGAAAAVLRTDASGVLSLVNLVTPLISTDTSVNMLIAPGGDLTIAPVGGDTFVTGSFKVTGNANVTGDLDVDAVVYGNIGVITPNLHNTSTLAISSASTITLDSATDMIHILSNNNLQTDNFASELLGWRMTYSGELDARYIYSEQMKVKLFIAEMEMAIAGSQMVLKSSTTTSRPFLVPYPGYYSRLYVNDLKGAEDMAAFQAGDMVRLRVYSRSGGSLDTTDGWGKVYSYNNETGKEQRWNWLREGDCTINLPAQVGLAQTTSSSSTTSRTLTKVSGTASGHQMYAFITWANTAAVITPPSGWTLLSTSSITGLKVALYTKTAGGAEPANYTWTWDVATAAAGHLSAWSNILDPDLEIGITQKTVATNSYLSSDVFVISPACLIFTFTGATTNTNIDQLELWQEITDVGTTNLRNQVSYTTSMDNGLQSGYSGAISSATTSITITVHAIPTYSGLNLTTGYMAPGQYIPDETTAMDYGVGGNGWHEITAVDGAYGSNSPYARIVTWTTHPAIDPVVRTQMGHLKGLFGVANEFGFYAGTGTTSTDAYLRLSSYASSFNNIPVTMYQSGTTRIKLDASSGLNLKLASAEDTLTAIRWQETLGVSTDGAKIDVFDGGDATQMIISLEAITASPVAVMQLRTYDSLGTRPATITLTSYDSDTPYSNVGINAKTIAIGSFSGPGTSAVIINAASTGSLKVQCGANIGTNTTQTTYDGTLSVGNVSTTYSPTTSNWTSGGGTTLLLNAASYSVIGFHDSLDRVDFIRVGAGTMTLGYDGGWGSPYVSIPGGALVGRGASSNGALTIAGTAFNSHFNYATDEHTFIRGGKLTSNVYINDANTGLVSISAGGGPTVFGGRIGEAWSGFTFGSGWANYGGDYQTGQVKKVGDVVFLRGLVYRFIGSGTTIATLPAGYRPPARCLVGVHTNTGLGRVDIDTSGNIMLVAGGADWVQLNGLVFSVAS